MKHESTVAAFLILTLCAASAGARQAAQLEVRPPRAVADSFDPVAVEVFVTLDGTPVPSLPEDLGHRVVGGTAKVSTEWKYDAAGNSWSYRFMVQPQKVGLLEVEFYHRELDGIGARARFGLQVVLNDNAAPPRVYRVQPGGAQRLDLAVPIYLLKEATLHLLLAVDAGDLDQLTYQVPGTRDLSLEIPQPGEVIVHASRDPETPGARRALVIHDQTGRRPDTQLKLVIVEPCLICGGAHNEDVHPSEGRLAEAITADPSAALPDLTLLEVADAAVFSALNMIEPAPTYLETTERTAMFRGWVTERLAQLEVVIEYPDGEIRHFPMLLRGQGEQLPFQHTFRLKTGTNRLTYLITDTDGIERKARFNLFRQDEN